MGLLLPIFPHDTIMITMSLGVREQNGFVYYLHSGMPIFSHEKGDLKKFHYITSNLILQGLCTNQNIVDTFHVSTQIRMVIPPGQLIMIVIKQTLLTQ